MSLDKSIFDRMDSWEKIKKTSTWHFNDKPDLSEKTFFPLCKFVGNWQEGIIKATEDSIEQIFSKDNIDFSKLTDDNEAAHVILDTLKAMGKDHISTLWETEIYRVNKFGDDGKILSETKVDYPEYKPFYQMLEKIGMYEPHKVRVTIQRLGQTSPMHTDGYYFNNDYLVKDENLAKRYTQIAGENHLKLSRVFISLTPYTLGQIWQFGHSFWTCYDAGECITFDWRDMPHGTSNFGFAPRVNLQATGFVNEKFQWLLDNGSKDYIINLD